MKIIEEILHKRIFVCKDDDEVLKAKAIMDTLLQGHGCQIEEKDWEGSQKAVIQTVVIMHK